MRNADPKWQTPGIAMILFLLWGIVAVIIAVMSFAQEQWVTGFIYLGTIVGMWVWTELTLVIFEIHKVLIQIREQAAKPQDHRTPTERIAAQKANAKRLAESGEMRLG